MTHKEHFYYLKINYIVTNNLLVSPDFPSDSI